MNAHSIIYSFIQERVITTPRLIGSTSKQERVCVKFLNIQWADANGDGPIDMDTRITMSHGGHRRGEPPYGFC